MLLLAATTHRKTDFKLLNSGLCFALQAHPPVSPRLTAAEEDEDKASSQSIDQSINQSIKCVE